MFKSGWSDFEESSYVIIWEQNGSYFIKEEGHNVFSGDYYSKRKISQEEALEIMLEEINNENDDYLFRI